MNKSNRSAGWKVFQEFYKYLLLYCFKVASKSSLIDTLLDASNSLKKPLTNFRRVSSSANPSCMDCKFQKRQISSLKDHHSNISFFISPPFLPKTRSRSSIKWQVARKLAMVEADLERAEERAEAGEGYVFDQNRVFCLFAPTRVVFCCCLIYCCFIW